MKNNVLFVGVQGEPVELVKGHPGAGYKYIAHVADKLGCIYERCARPGRLFNGAPGGSDILIYRARPTARLDLQGIHWPSTKPG